MNAIGPLKARLRRAVRFRSRFPNEHSVMKILYLVLGFLHAKGTGETRWAQGESRH